MKPGIHYPILSFCMLEISYLSESSVPSPSLNLSNQVHSITTLDSSPKGPQRTSLNSFHLGTYVPSRHSNACTHTLQAGYAMLLQPLVESAGGTPVAGCGAALSHHQSCHVDPRGFKPLLMEGGDGEEPRAT